MAIIVETGTGAADSEVLCSVAFSDTYHANLGNAAWALLLPTEKEAALRRAYAYMTQTYRLRWAGYRVKDTQALDWPRQQVPRTDVFSGYGGNMGNWGNYYPYDAIPLELQRANAECAFKAAGGELLEDLTANVKSEQVGPIQVVYQDNAIQIKRFIAIDRLLMPFLSGGGNIKLTRA